MSRVTKRQVLDANTVTEKVNLALQHAGEKKDYYAVQVAELKERNADGKSYMETLWDLIQTLQPDWQEVCEDEKVRDAPMPSWIYCDWPLNIEKVMLVPYGRICHHCGGSKALLLLIDTGGKVTNTYHLDFT